MPITQLDILRRQAESAYRNQVQKETAQLRRSTSLVQQAARLTGRGAQALEQARQRGSQPRPGAIGSPQSGKCAPTDMCGCRRASPSTPRRDTGAGWCGKGWACSFALGPSCCCWGFCCAAASWRFNPETVTAARPL